MPNINWNELLATIEDAAKTAAIYGFNGYHTLFTMALSNLWLIIFTFSAVPVGIIMHREAGKNA